MTHDNEALSPSEIQARAGVHGVLDIEVVEIDPDRVVISMPIGEKVYQPFGILHGGVSALLAESAASMAGSINVPEGKGVVGIEISASHLRSAVTGTLIAVATPIRKGRTIQVWRIELSDQDGRMICDAKCTLAVVDRPAS
ncbi:MAG: PaaI family thioesterase [Actinomycetes bacterium]